MPAKNELPYMTSVVTDELAVAEDLTNEELGAYYRLKLKLWRADGFLPEDKLVSASRAGKRWGAIGRAVMEHITVGGGRFSMGAVLIGLMAVRERRAKRVERAAEAAEARWEIARAQARGKPVSEVALGQISDTLLTATNSLKTNKPTMLGASSKQCLEIPNQIQTDIESRTLSANGAAAGLSEEEKAKPAGTRTDAYQYDLLFKHGGELLRQRLGQSRLSGHTQIAEWLRRVGDSEQLAIILGHADQSTLRGEDFLTDVETRVSQCERERLGEVAASLKVPIKNIPTSVVDSASAAVPVINRPVDNTGDDEPPSEQPNPAAADEPFRESARLKLWIFGEGKRQLIERYREHPGRADTLIERWLREVDGFPAALANILTSAFARADNKARLYELIDVEIGLHHKRQAGAQLGLVAEVSRRSPAEEAPARGESPTSDIRAPPFDFKKAVGDE